MRIAKVIHNEIPMAKLKKLSTYCKRNKRYGVWMEAEELKNGKFDVVVYHPSLYTDKFGNTCVGK